MNNTTFGGAPPTIPERESSFELLRLLCMFFILFLHVFGSSLNIIGISVSATVFESFFIVAVNCFVLISGYFSINAGWRSFVRLYVFCVSYYLLFAVIAALNITGAHSFGLSSLKRIALAFFPFTHSGNWFLQVYFCLFLLSPILNQVSASLGKRKYVLCLAVLTVINVWMGFYADNPIPLNSNPNSNGYNIMSFIYLYFIGRYIYLHLPDSYKVKTYLTIYILCSLALSGLILLVARLRISDWYVLKLSSLNYNNPLILSSSVALFLVFKKLKFHSKKINWLASSGLAVYIIHTSVPYGRIFQYIKGKYGAHWYVGALYFAAVTAIFFACLLIDKLRMLITGPAEHILCGIDIGKYYGKLKSRLRGGG